MYAVLLSTVLISPSFKPTDQALHMCSKLPYSLDWREENGPLKLADIVKTLLNDIKTAVSQVLLLHV